MDGTDGVAEVPENECAFFVGEVGDAFHVVHVAAFENDMREGNKRGVLVDGSFERGNVGSDVVVACTNADDLMTISKRLIDALQDIKIGWEIEGVSDDAGFVGLQGERRGGEFEEIDRDCIADKSLPRRCTNELTDLIPHTSRSIPPAFVPTTDEVLAPLFINDLTRFLLRGFWHHAERIAVKVDKAWV